eukprot:NP_509699.1 Uncharacterized protein CELE_T06H11.2 [Caenorhabditis elegans]
MRPPALRSVENGLFRTRPQSNRPRAYSMLPLTSSISQEEVFQDRIAFKLCSPKSCFTILKRLVVKSVFLEKFPCSL